MESSSNRHIHYHKTTTTYPYSYSILRFLQQENQLQYNLKVDLASLYPARAKLDISWETFHQQYADIVPQTPRLPSKKIKPAAAFSSKEVEEFSRKTAAKKIQRLWGQKRNNRSQLVKVITGRKHSRVFVYFLNGKNASHPILKSLHKSDLAQLRAAIDSGNLAEPIFATKQLPFLLITLFMQEKITDQQLFSLLEFNQVLNLDRFIIPRVGQCIDGDSRLHEEFIQWVKPYLLDASESKLRFIVSLIHQLPLSERLYYVSIPHQQQTGLTPILCATGGIKKVPFGILHLSAGVEDAIGLANHGLNYTRPIPRLGVQSLDDIEYGVRRNVRPASMYYPGRIPFADIHGFKNPLLFEATQHDRHHANVRSNILKDVKNIMLALVDLIRDITGIKWSREIWDWIDSDYRYGLISPDREKNTTKFFCRLLLMGNSSRSTIFMRGGYIAYPQGDANQQNMALTKCNLTQIHAYHLSVLGSIFLLDLVYNKKKWQRLGINVEQLEDPFKTFYFHAQAMKGHLETIRSPITKIFFLYAACLLFTSACPRELNALATYVQSNENRLDHMLTFKKLPKGTEQTSVVTNKIREQENCVVFALGDLIVDLKLIKRLLNNTYERNLHQLFQPRAILVNKINNASNFIKSHKLNENSNNQISFIGKFNHRSNF